MIDEQTEANGITEWLRHKGYPFESQVADTCDKAGFRTMQSARYGDPRTGISRESDVIAWRENALESLVELSVTLVIECKVVDESIPWVVLSHRTPSGYEANRYWSIFASKIGRSVLFGLPSVESIPRLPLFPRTRETGYALLEGPPYAGAKVKDGRPDPGDALLQVSAAAEARAEQADRFRADDTEFADIVFPVVVIRGRLYESEIVGGQVSPSRRLNRALILLRPNPRELGYRAIHVVTSDAVGEFLTDARATADRLISRSDEALSEFRKDQRRRR